MENISTHEATLISTNNFLPGMDEHKIEEIPGEKPLTEEPTETKAPVTEPLPEEKVGSDDLTNMA